MANIVEVVVRQVASIAEAVVNLLTPGPPAGSPSGSGSLRPGPSRSDAGAFAEAPPASPLTDAFVNARPTDASTLQLAALGSRILAAQSHGAPDAIARVIAAESLVSGYDANLLAKIARVESSFNPNAGNFSDRPPSIGLMGIKSSTAISVMGWNTTSSDAENRLRDPVTNMRVATRILRSIEANQSRARADRRALVGMYHLGEPRWLLQDRFPAAHAVDVADNLAYLRRYDAA